MTQKEKNITFQSHIGKQSSCADAPLRSNGGALYKTYVTFTQKKAV